MQSRLMTVVKTATGTVISDPAWRFAAALLLTLLAESAAAGLLGVRDKLDYLLIAGANLITNPIVNVVAAAVRIYAGAMLVPAVLALEILTVFAEYALYRRTLRFTRIPLLLFSLILNAVSFAAGILWSVLS